MIFLGLFFIGKQRISCLLGLLFIDGIYHGLELFGYIPSLMSTCTGAFWRRLDGYEVAGRLFDRRGIGIIFMATCIITHCLTILYAAILC